MTHQNLNTAAFAARAFVLAIALGASAKASAVSLLLAYSGDNQVAADGTVFATHGDELVFEIIADFRDHPTLGGGYDIAFDEAGLAFLDFVGLRYCSWYCDGEYAPGSGVVANLGFGRFDPITGPVTVATVTFRFTGGNGDLMNIALQATDGIAGPFISGLDFVTPLDVDFGDARVQGVPVPAAWFLMASAIAALGWRGRR